MFKNLARQGDQQVGKTHGDDYVVEHCQHRAGSAYSLYAYKELACGRIVARHTHLPSLWESSEGIREYYLVHVGWEEYTDDQDASSFVAPPILSLPEKALGWYCTAYDGPINWFAKFTDNVEAEAFALKVPLGDQPPLNLGTPGVLAYLDKHIAEQAAVAVANSALIREVAQAIEVYGDEVLDQA